MNQPLLDLHAVPNRLGEVCVPKLECFEPFCHFLKMDMDKGNSCFPRRIERRLITELVQDYRPPFEKRRLTSSMDLT